MPTRFVLRKTTRPLRMLSRFPSMTLSSECPSEERNAETRGHQPNGSAKRCARSPALANPIDGMLWGAFKDTGRSPITG